MPRHRSPRSSRDERRTDLLDHAARAILAQGGLPLSYDQLAVAAGVSKALVYNYFPSQIALGNALIEDELAGVDRDELRRLAATDDLVAAARGCAYFYFDIVVDRGPLLHMLLADPLLNQGQAAYLTSRSGLLLLPIVRRLRRAFGISAREANIIVQLLITLPEEAGKQVFQGSSTRERARRLCADTVEATLSALQGDRSADGALALGIDLM
ncbi:TetR/AcrR family transcriptional regulator [Blastomonas sp.]|uniref:TetR/AcrR family transcriptional regulator n=1 Tax=Blastomonas sp. TaxID=1909299 RepID=UPI0026050A3D|nr:TetR/AcrR family transcriptional regulator [Blastomonas sp.]MDM7956983.1 TetR/AcrR family transcriptional regulator [Blastomonas sp.]